MDDFIVTIDDLRKTGHCVVGIKRWFGANGLDFNNAVKNGIAASVLLSTGDEMAVEVVAKVRKRLGHG